MGELSDSLAESLTVGVGSDDDQVRPGAAMIPQVAHISIKLPCHSAVAAGRTAPLLVYVDATLLGDALHQGADHQFVRVIFAEQSDVMHRSPL